jgi:cyclic beta-1,2-glucan synthetase
VSRPPSNGRRPWPGRRPRSSSITSGSNPTRPTSSSAWPTGILYSDPSLRPAASLLARNERGAPGLWAHGISGDLPIVLVRIDETEEIDIVRQLLRAHEYWRLKLLDVDLVILNEHGTTYAQDLHDSLETLVRTSQSTLVHEGHPGHGGVYILRGDQLSAEDRTLLQTAARAVLLSRRGSLADQVIRLERPERIAPPAAPPGSRQTKSEVAAPRPELEFFNGLGGFADGGREYVVILGPGQSTPAPWLNVIANAIVRVPGLRIRVRLYVVREQPREPAHPMVQRSRQRPGERGDLRSG